ncbi:MAG TPA: hypothetical protein VFJ78_09020 [Gaiellaceae bacterium]|nr:hypothetical protein [Gaiellaceae bacterium]
MSVDVSPASYRDAAGFVYRRSGTLYRQVNESFRDDFDLFIASGLYDELTADGLVVEHEEADLSKAASRTAYRVLKPRTVPYISYPYEWSVGQLRDAALLTLELQTRALRRGLTLRDASAFNVQFMRGRPVFIDTLSFGRYEEGKPWAAYRQFCEHFLGPLALMVRRDPRMSLLHRGFADGIPLELVSSLLGARAFRSLGLWLHLRAHANAQRRFGDAGSEASRRTLSRAALDRLVTHLRETVESLRWSPGGTAWADYEEEHGYSAADVRAKQELVKALVEQVEPRSVLDLGANAGQYSAIAAAAGASVVALDLDVAAVERHYLRVRESRADVLPLVMDLRNPSPALGWAHRERMSLAERGPSDLVLALALVHHLVLAGNVPLRHVASYLAVLGTHAIVEFVPYDDPQAQRLVATRGSPEHAYTRQAFEQAFGESFAISSASPVGSSGRTIYSMTRRDDGEPVIAARAAT